MTTSRRDFLQATAAAASAALAASCTAAPSAPYQVSIRSASGAPGDPAPTTSSNGLPLLIPATMAMASGAPLGGIGTGFVEIRADGCFYEWQIFNSGSWAQNARSTTAAPAKGPQYLRFELRTKAASEPVAQIRRLFLRSDDNDLYTLPYVQDVQSIDYQAWFPMTGLTYNDPSIPIRASAAVFSTFIPGNAQASATPGFHVVFTLQNTSSQTVEASLAGFLDNPLASALPDRKLTNTLTQESGVTTLLLNTDAQSDFPSGIGNMCLSVTGGDHSYITGTFQQYSQSSSCRWNTNRSNYMLLNILGDFWSRGILPNSQASTDPTASLLTNAQVDALSPAEVQAKIKALFTDALLGRIFSDAQQADPVGYASAGKALLKEVRSNLLNDSANPPTPRLTWGSGALASTVKLAPGQSVEIRFTLSWFFPHHLTTRGRDMGHMYANWFKDAADVNTFLRTNYAQHRATTESFARTLMDTSLGDPLAFAWSSQLSTAIFNTWWTKDAGYAMWEGLGCCGLSTTDVDYQGSFPITALFPELKLSQMKRIIAHQNARGQVPHNYSGDVNQVDNGFARVDMNSQFVMMACRDYLWTGDHDYLTFMWPYIVKAMAFTESLDTNGDALPDRDTGLQTYDQWRMRGTPSYIASLWIGALRAAIRLANDAQQPQDAARWTDLLAKASASFDKILFNGQYYSLWADGPARDELCMTDQISGEWFSHLIGLPTSISQDKLMQAVDNIFKNNFNPEFGLHNATAPKRGTGILAITNLQAGGVWSGIEFAFASFLMDHDRFAQGVQIVEAVHRRYLRAGQPWNHVECGGHYSRAMSSWATLLAATGFKPDLPNKSLAILPSAPGDFHAPWATASGFGLISRAANALSIKCTSGTLAFQKLQINLANPSARIGARPLEARSTKSGSVTTLEFSAPVSLTADQTLTLN